jgi:hypothetical protein
MHKTILLGFITLCTSTAFSQQHILDKGTIAPCNATNNPNIRTDDENVNIIFHAEMPVYPHVQGKVVSGFKVGDTWNVLVKTKDDFYVKFGNLRKAFVKQGDYVGNENPIGIPLPGSNAATWKLLISYDTKTETMPCPQAVAMIKVSHAFVVKGASQ